jgi:hypothetical protein
MARKAKVRKDTSRSSRTKKKDSPKTRSKSTGKRPAARKRRKDAPLAAVSERRGFVEEPSGNSWLTVLADAAAETLAKCFKKDDDVVGVEPCTLSRLPKKPLGDFYFLIQLKGHTWTHIVGRHFFDAKLGAKLSERTGKDVILAGCEKHSEDFFQRWSNGKLKQHLGTENDDVDLDQVLREHDVYVPVFYCVEQRRLALVCYPEDVLSSTSIESIFFVTTAPTPEELRRRELDSRAKALYTAISDGSLAGVKKAIAKGADVNALPSEGRETPLGAAVGPACRSGDTAIVEELISAGADPNDGGEFATVAIAGHQISLSERGAMRVIWSLAQCGGDVNRRGEFGMTALEWAGSKAKLPALKLLIKLGADPTHTADLSLWMTDRDGDCVTNIDLLGRLKSQLKDQWNTENVTPCIKFLRDFKSGKITRDDIEDFEELVSAASDELSDFGKLANEYRRRKKAKRKK